MGHIPYGYRIQDGRAVVDEGEAARLRKLYENYLSGMALRTAASEAGIDATHGAAKKLMQTGHYLGDAFYPAIIDREIYEKAAAELQRRAAALGRLDRVGKAKTNEVPIKFFFLDIEKHFDDPIKQAEYMYSRIECEVSEWET